MTRCVTCGRLPDQECCEECHAAQDRAETHWQKYRPKGPATLTPPDQFLTIEHPND